MLAPESRALLTDALRPPDGCRVDLAVATSYSLDLTALLLAPMSFALHESNSDDIDAVDGIALLESLRRYADRTTVFCQAGGIHLPPKFSPLLQFVEDTVCQVTAPMPGRIFHPKLWVLRFRAADDSSAHRVLVLSRNLTFDRCWDTLLRIDEADDVAEGIGPDVGPLVSFLTVLPSLATTALEPDRADQVTDLATTLARARLQLPSDFTDLQFLPFGTGDPSWTIPEEVADRALLISPFLDRQTVSRAARSARTAIFLSRPESLDRVGTRPFDEEHQPWTLQRAAEVEVGDDPEPAGRAPAEWSTVRDGLHAKTFIFEHGTHATVITGSANLTTAGLNGNVELSVALTGPTSRCGVAAVWEGTAEAPGLVQLAQPYEPKEWGEEEAARAALELEIDQFHRELATTGFRVDITATGDNVVDVAVSTPAVKGPGDSVVWPISLPSVRSRAFRPADVLRWQEQARRDITPFIAIETTADRDGVHVRERAVIKATLTGDLGNRRLHALTEILRNPTDVLKYLALLLADPRLDALVASDGYANDGQSFDRKAGFHDLVLLEPLLRASARDDEAIERVSDLLNEIESLADGENLLPAGFHEIWNAVHGARQEAP